MLRIRKYELLMGAVLAVALGLCLPYFISYYVYGDYSGKEAQAAEIIPVSGGGFATPTGQANPFATDQAPFSAQFVQIATDIVFPTNTPRATFTPTAFMTPTRTPFGTYTPTPRDKRTSTQSDYQSGASLANTRPNSHPGEPTTSTPKPTNTPLPTNTSAADQYTEADEYSEANKYSGAGHKYALARYEYADPDTPVPPDTNTPTPDTPVPPDTNTPEPTATEPPVVP